MDISRLYPSFAFHEHFVILTCAIGDAPPSAADRAAAGHEHSADRRNGIVSVIAVFGATLGKTHEIGLQWFQSLAGAVETGKIGVVGSVIGDEPEEAAAFPLRAVYLAWEHAATDRDQPGCLAENAIRAHPVRCGPTEQQITFP